MEIIDNSNKKVFDLFISEEEIEEICILSGYCSYSAFYDIANNDKAKKMFLNTKVKIIMGMNIDPKIHRIYMSYSDEENKKSNQEEINDFEEYSIFQLNKSEENAKVLELFKEKCKNSTLEIRSANDKTHAKIYLLKHKLKNSLKGVTGEVIIGSSNFSSYGLKNQREINVYGSDIFKDAYKIFEREWEDSKCILDINNHKEFFNRIGMQDNDNDSLKNLIRTPTPYEIYLKVIYEYFSFFTSEELLFNPNDYHYSNYKYQIDAIKTGIKSIMLYDGVLISDVVGLGKSIIASTIAKNLLEKKYIEEILIISPPKIIYSWENYNAEFKLNAKVFSIGLLDKVYDYVKSHNKKRLIIIDEAHRFVNNQTTSYSIIKDICAMNSVMLITATPMHNTTSDIFSLVDIFDRILTTNRNIIDIKNKILKEERKIKLDYKENDDKKETKKKMKDISKQILSLINPIIIRRTRRDLIEDIEYKKDLEKQKIEFNIVESPKLHDYNLGDISKLYFDTFEKISPYEENDENEENEENDKNKENLANNKFKAVRYEPLVYLKYNNEKEKEISNKIIRQIYGENINIDFASTSSRNLTKFMKLLLVRRFESSVYAFKKSIDNMIDKYDNIKSWINKGYYPIYKRGDMLYTEDFFSYEDNVDEDIDDDVLDYDKLNKKYKDVKLIEDVKNVLDSNFFTEFENDLKVLNEIKNDWKDIGFNKDRKFKKLIELLKEFQKENDKRKIIIFTEFKDTADYLYDTICEDEKLSEILKPIKSTSQSKNKDIIIANFDASVDISKQEDDYFLLIATDTLSEGINLHRAGIIINYDIPYNPTRVIQRVGRINRIGKKLFDKIYIHNFIPRLEAQKDIKNWQISNFKLNLINAIFGNDTKILKDDDEINSLLSLKKENLNEDDDVSWDNEYRDVFNRLKNDEKLLKRIKEIDNNIVVKRKADFKGIIEIVRSSNGIFGALLKESKIDFNIENIFKILKANENEKYLPASEKIIELEEELKRKKNIKTANKKSDTSIILDEIAKNIDNEDKKEYIKKLSYLIDNKHLTEKNIREIDKLLKSEVNIDVIKNIISIQEAEDKFNYYTNNLESVYKNSNLIVKEEFDIE